MKSLPKSCEIATKNNESRLVPKDYLNNDVHEFKEVLVRTTNETDEVLNEAISRSISQIQKLREVYAKNSRKFEE